MTTTTSLTSHQEPRTKERARGAGDERRAAGGSILDEEEKEGRKTKKRQRYKSVWLSDAMEPGKGASVQLGSDWTSPGVTATDINTVLEKMTQSRFRELMSKRSSCNPTKWISLPWQNIWRGSDIRINNICTTWKKHTLMKTTSVCYLELPCQTKLSS